MAAIPLGRMLPSASCNLPGRLGWKLPEGCPSRRPYSVLLPVGFTVPLPLPVARWALTPPFHPCPAEAGRFAFCGTFPGVRPRRMLSGTVFPRSPDFPRTPPFDDCVRGRPAGWWAYKGALRKKRKAGPAFSTGPGRQWIRRLP